MTTQTTHYQFDKPAVGETGWGPLRNTNMDDVDAELARPRIPQSALTWGATTTVNLALARVFTGTNSEISTVAFSNVPATLPDASVPFVRWLLLLTNGGAFAITWPGSVTWLSGTAPELKAAGVDAIEFFTRDGGTTVYGRLLNGLEPWKVDSSGHFRPKTTNTYDIGTTSLKPRDVYVGRDLYVAGQVEGALTVNGGVSSYVGNSTTVNRVSHMVHSAGNRTTTLTTATDIDSFALPANTLHRNGVVVRITVSGTFGATAGGLFRVLFGSMVVLSLTDGTGGANFFAVIDVARRASSSQRSSAFGVVGTAVELDNASGTETDTGAITIHIESDQAGAGTFTLRHSAIQVLDPEDGGNWL